MLTSSRIDRYLQFAWSQRANSYFLLFLKVRNPSKILLPASADERQNPFQQGLTKADGSKLYSCVNPFTTPLPYR